MAQSTPQPEQENAFSFTSHIVVRGPYHRYNRITTDKKRGCSLTQDVLPMTPLCRPALASPLLICYTHPHWVIS
jgi:hypothetical protein